MEEVNQISIPKTIEFQVSRDFADNLPDIISNIAQLEEFVKIQTERDRNLVLIDDESREQAKKQCSTYQKLRKQLSDKRIDIKKAYTEPLTIFEEKLKKVDEILGSARDNLWSQITKAENEVKQAKEDKLRAYWLGKKCNYRTYEQIASAKWLTKSVKEEQAFIEMDKIKETILTEVNAILSLKSEFEVSLIDYYKQGKTLTEVITYNNKLQAQKQVLNAQRQEIKTVEQEREEKAVEMAKNEPQEILEIDFRVHCTAEQLQGLKNYLIANGIKYGKVPTNKGE